jgi:hypothetical protein
MEMARLMLSGMRLRFGHDFLCHDRLEIIFANRQMDDIKFQYSGLVGKMCSL